MSKNLIGLMAFGLVFTTACGSGSDSVDKSESNNPGVKHHVIAGTDDETPVKVEQPTTGQTPPSQQTPVPGGETPKPDDTSPPKPGLDTPTTPQTPPVVADNPSAPDDQKPGQDTPTTRQTSPVVADNPSAPDDQRPAQEKPAPQQQDAEGQQQKPQTPQQQQDQQKPRVPQQQQGQQSEQPQASGESTRQDVLAKAMERARVLFAEAQNDQSTLAARLTDELKELSAIFTEAGDLVSHNAAIDAIQADLQDLPAIASADEFLKKAATVIVKLKALKASHASESGEVIAGEEPATPDA